MRENYFIFTCRVKKNFDNFYRRKDAFRKMFSREICITLSADFTDHIRFDNHTIKTDMVYRKSSFVCLE